MASCSRTLVVLCLTAQLAFLGRASTTNIRAKVGEDVTLPCVYNARYYGMSMCWGRGRIPTSGCANQIIRANKARVTERASTHYQFLSNRRGDRVTLALIIKRAQEKDSGLYGCRVEVPGWFNDYKHHVNLMVVAGRPNPLKVEITEVTERTLTVHWASVFDGGWPITTYIVHLKEDQESWDSAKKSELYNPQLTRVTMMDLHPARTYNLRMFALNGKGLSDSSNVLTVTTKEAAPDGPPIDMQLQALASRSINVTWKPPRANLTNGALTSYVLSYREHDSAGTPMKTWEHHNVPVTGEVETHTLTNLKPSTQYSVTVLAKTDSGEGPIATAPLCTTLDEELPTTTVATVMTSPATTVWNTSVGTAAAAETATVETTVREEGSTAHISGSPGPPVIKLKEVDGFTISLRWTPGFEGDSPITGYYLEYKTLNVSWDYTTSTVDFSSNETEATIIELIPSTYNIRMFAKNSLGRSKASNVLTFTINEKGNMLYLARWLPGHVRAVLTTATPSMDSRASLRFEVGQSGHLVTIVAPLVLLVLIVAVATGWHLQRIKQKEGSLDRLLHSETVHYRKADHDCDEESL